MIFTTTTIGHKGDPSMSQSFRGSPRQTQQFDDVFDEEEELDQGLHAEPETAPSLKLLIGMFEVGFGTFTNAVQLVTTTLAIIGMIIGAATITATLATHDIPELVHLFAWYCLIGIVIAGAIQGFLHKNAQPAERTWSKVRNAIQKKQALKHVQNMVTFNTLYFVLALGADVISDATFINMFTHNALVILFWIVFLTGSSTLLLYDGWTRVAQAIEDYKDYRRFHMAYDDEDAS
jgi:hypothetical protein